MSSRIKRTKTLQPAAESSKQARKLIEVVPDGDVLLKVGQEAEALDIRVSGLVISLASDMFSRMLSSSFTEASTKVIELKDDDPEVVLDFCNIAHHKIENLDHCNGLRLLKLAELADARFCERVLRPWVATTLYSALSALEKWERDKTDVTVASELPWFSNSMSYSG
ncbi:uncharacterized protein A1O5_02178 [Cladophialophora psammophila CBS 110553]|uniref:BTB domain-containing protein n=1 Tax=Cladophialophora psammophila CBS 110553 TaxID=1182543 RepID=W9X4Q5_9EURO|nr:uncharacterized protein A1O5_02178 [Cladophialophora psammophila CBS 110553]EXJ75482.1 hypothetical protein A1O5_02178 [Cladophialophora psammophila CBS 110553]